LHGKKIIVGILIFIVNSIIIPVISTIYAWYREAMKLFTINCNNFESYIVKNEGKE